MNEIKKNKTWILLKLRENFTKKIVYLKIINNKILK